MNAKTKIAVAVLGISTLATLTSKAGVSVVVGVPAPPAVVVAAPAPPPPAPAVVVEQPVPDSYVWDGTEYVGVVGTSYFYLGPNHVWLAFDPVHEERFHAWERDHHDWREHTIHNESFRGHEAPAPHRDDVRHDDHDHDKDRH